MTNTTAVIIAQSKRASAHTLRTIRNGAFVLIIAALAAVVLIQVQGYAALPTIGAGFEYSLGSPTAIARTLAWGLPLVVAALGVSLAFRSGMFNLGAEGQVYAGAMAAAIVGAYIGPVFSGLHLLLATAAAALVGGLIAGGLGWLRAKWNVDEVVSSLLSNYIVILFCTYLVTGPLRDPSRQSGTTQRVFDTAMFTEIIPRTGLTWSIVLVVAVAGFVWWLSERSVTGYRWRMTGSAPGFAATSGIDTARSQIRSMVVSGAFAAVAGSLLVTASQGRYWTEIGSGIGWDAVLIALVARAKPIPTIIWVGIYSIMRSTARGIEQVSTVPSELSSVLISIIIIVVAARAGLFTRVASLWARLTARKER
ncbi:ABC transporter permease [Leucobacter luti]|uniref:Nucleoside ABC transporter membrane protein n=1 Tax=Leucobacter luti TaxID=340320 RepID=A0A4Q7U2J9_9MICO|nr:ABC transporter permease [Leucobacter luti]RZT66870.1 nucleoside ABC transporter membrane protein [Leucobacter luti]